MLLLLLFDGMEISPAALIARWRVAVIGTALQIGISVGCVGFAGTLLGWDAPRIVLLGFVISLSSTAVVPKLLRQSENADPGIAQDATAILLAQDLAIVPMMIGLSFLSGADVSNTTLVTQALGAIGLLVLVVLVLLTNTGINAIALRVLGSSWKRSF